MVLKGRFVLFVRLNLLSQYNLYILLNHLVR